MIIIALGANLPSRYGSPVDTLIAARAALRAHDDIQIAQSSHIWLTAPVPFDADQEWYHNAVIAIETSLSAHDLLTVMLNIEEKFGRIRTIKNAPRLLDLDLIAYNNEIIKDNDRLIVPHPRMHERLFVLSPLADIYESWIHPITGHSVAEMIQNLPTDQQAKALDKKGQGAW